MNKTIFQINSLFPGMNSWDFRKTLNIPTISQESRSKGKMIRKLKKLRRKQGR